MDKNVNLVSVIITTKDRNEFFEQALQSACKQIYRPLEIIIVDSGNTPPPLPLSANNTSTDISIVYHKIDNENNISQSRNSGLKIAKGNYIAMLDNDDLWFDTNKIKEQKEFLEDHSDYALVGTFVEKINNHNEKVAKIEFETTDKNIKNKILGRNQFTQSSVLFRKEAVLNVGGYDETLPIWEDYDLWLRLGAQLPKESNKLANIPKFCTGYRVHGSNISRQRKLFGAQLHIKIISKYKNNYPNFNSAYVKGLLRVVLRLIGF